MKKIISAIVIASCIFTISCKKKEPIQEPVQVKAEGLFLGVVGFNDDVFITPPSNNVTQTKSAIDQLTNKIDQTALCYGMSKGIDQIVALNAAQSLDQAFIVAFTDGFDNYSGKFFPQVGQGGVVAHTTNLLKNASISGKPIKTYTIGFQGTGVVVDSDLQSLAVNGQYLKANSSTLQSVFQTIAKSLISTSSNVSIITSYTSIIAADPKLFKITFNTYTDENYNSGMTPYTIEAQFTNVNTNTPVFKITSPKVANISFIGDNGAPITGAREGSTKYNVPLANLTITSPGTGQPVFIKDITVTYKFSSGSTYVNDVEDTKGTKAIAKNVAVVLVLDCSSSLGNVFTPMKQYSKEFIQTLVTSKK